MHHSGASRSDVKASSGPRSMSSAHLEQACALGRADCGLRQVGALTGLEHMPARTLGALPRVAPSHTSCVQRLVVIRLWWQAPIRNPPIRNPRNPRLLVREMPDR
eukprot:7047166-Alexandrium_andersonii.AAC.1